MNIEKYEDLGFQKDKRVYLGRYHLSGGAIVDIPFIMEGIPPSLIKEKRLSSDQKMLEESGVTKKEFEEFIKNPPVEKEKKAEDPVLERDPRNDPPPPKR